MLLCFLGFFFSEVFSFCVFRDSVPHRLRWNANSPKDLPFHSTYTLTPCPHTLKQGKGLRWGDAIPKRGEVLPLGCRPGTHF